MIDSPHLTARDTQSTTLWPLLALLTCSAVACDFPGRPNPADQFMRPDAIVDFAVLYRQNCRGCHGAEGVLGPGPPLADKMFLNIIPRDELRRVVAEGRTGTPMAPFAAANGGSLTAAQIDALVAGIEKQWGGGPTEEGLPSYLADTCDASATAVAGNETAGAEVFARACANCHGDEGKGDHDTMGPINEPAFLALVSDQELRRYIITGRADLGMPNYASSEGRDPKFEPLSSREIADLVALLASWRKEGT